MNAVPETSAAAGGQCTRAWATARLFTRNATDLAGLDHLIDIVAV